VVRLHASPGKAPAFAPPVVHEALRSQAAPLPAATRARMEAGLGHDFGDVQVHVGPRAAASAREVGAAAYAVGPHVVFAAGRYRPETAAGDALIAHELAHVAQQPPAEPDGEIPIVPADDPRERAAERLDGVPPPAARVALARKLDCDITQDEGFPLLKRGAYRNAVGVAQVDLNERLATLKTCVTDPKCMAGFSPKAQNFILEQIGMLLKNPIDVDCQFGLDTLHATYAVQASFFRDEAEWDGVIGEETWHAIDRFAPAPAPGPRVPPGLAPIPSPPGPVTL
jgi:uncharacterized protein DUF4157